jgi:hypothetical protein
VKAAENSGKGGVERIAKAKKKDGSDAVFLCVLT